MPLFLSVPTESALCFGAAMPEDIIILGCYNLLWGFMLLSCPKPSPAHILPCHIYRTCVNQRLHLSLISQLASGAQSTLALRAFLPRVQTSHRVNSNRRGPQNGLCCVCLRHCVNHKSCEMLIPSCAAKKDRKMRLK